MKIKKAAAAEKNYVEREKKEEKNVQDDGGWKLCGWENFFM